MAAATRGARQAAIDALVVGDDLGDLPQYLTTAEQYYGGEF